MIKYILILCSIYLSCLAFGENRTIEKFEKAKELLETRVYNQLPKTTVYCGATFNGKEITNSNGFYSTKYEERAKKLEWEHIVPAENFGMSFVEWRDGHEECIDNNGVPFKGRNCANKVNKEYRYMQSDMYNLYPEIGAVNALRSNYNFTGFSSNNESLGKCEMFFENRKVLPPDRAKGIIARTYFYMEKTYRNHFNIGSPNKQLFEVWDKQFPVTPDECKRAILIQELQGNINTILMVRCKEKGFW